MPSRSLKILHILDHSLPLHSGYTFRSQNIFRVQKNQGWEPVIVTSPKHEESWKKKTPPVEEVNDFKYYRSGAIQGRQIPFLGEIKLIKVLSERITKVAELERPDILHAHSPVLNAIAALRAGKKLGLPVVYEIRAFWEDAGVDLGTYRPGSLKYRLVRSTETWACGKAHGVVTICRGLEQDLIQRGINAPKISVVYNGINRLDFQSPSEDPESVERWGLHGKKVIGFIGSFYHYEGLDLLIKAFHAMATEHPEAVLLMVGGGEMEPELKQLVQRLDRSPEWVGPPSPANLRDRIIFTGRIPHEYISGIYSLIDILVYPRYSMRLTELVTPLKPLEAMAMGKALVASDVGGHKELIRDNETGILFKAGDLSSLRKALDQLLVRDDERKNLGETGNRWVMENHTWEKTTSPYEHVYAGLLRHPQSVK